MKKSILLTGLAALLLAAMIFPVMSYEWDIGIQVGDYFTYETELIKWETDGRSLEGAGGYMIVGDGSVDWGSAEGTISFWVKMDSTVQGRFWAQDGDMETRWSGTNLVLDWGSDTTITSATSFSADTWYFIAIAWNENSDDLFLYIGDTTNPPTADANSLDGSWASETPPVIENRFLNGMGADEPVIGLADDLRYWNTTRSLTELQSDYNVELTGSETNLRSYFKFSNDFTDNGPDSNHSSGSGSYSFSTDLPFSQSVQFPPSWNTGLLAINETESVTYTVTDIDENWVNFTEYRMWNNGSDLTTTLDYNLTAGPGWMVIGANLTEGEEIRGTTQYYGPMTLNASKMRTYNNSVTREVNVLNYTGFGIDNEYDFDVETGILVYMLTGGPEVSDVSTGGTVDYLARMELVDSSIEELEIVPDLTGVILISAIMVSTIPIAVLSKRKRK
jgi:hypothetical protein